MTQIITLIDLDGDMIGIDASTVVRLQHFPSRKKWLFWGSCGPGQVKITVLRHALVFKYKEVWVRGSYESVAQAITIQSRGILS